ncbi:PQQ-like beta-propeller repeat protein [Candidatus Poribacteria bacterium]|nr:PQQ-like beta-propeller repeat protein [Candidatus Poribacteria bacterium]
MAGRTCRLGLCVTVALWIVGGASADDWPTYARDYARSAATAEPLELPLTEVWAYHAPTPPTQAWPGPAKWDGWSKTFGLKDRMMFDKALDVAVVGDSVYFGSSVDDKVYCLDATTGDERWSVFTEGPVRLAPSVYDGKVYVGSDDGYVYCLDTDDGSEVWKHRPGPSDRRVPGNGRVISLWPIRTGVVVIDDIAYCCAGVFPSETVYLCAMNAATGEELWKNPLEDLAAQGYMLASASRLYVTTGREKPVVCSIADGERLFQVGGGGGGTYALLTGDTLLYGPGKTGQMGVFGDGGADQIASFDGNHMIVTPALSYLHTDTGLQALDRSRYLDLAEARKARNAQKSTAQEALKALAEDAPAAERRELRTQIAALADEVDALADDMRACYKWQVECDYPLSLLATGSAVIAGGEGAVAAYAAASGDELWVGKVDGLAYGLAAANGRVYVSTDTGAIHCFADARMARR